MLGAYRVIASGNAYDTLVTELRNNASQLDDIAQSVVPSLPHGKGELESRMLRDLEDGGRADRADPVRARDETIRVQIPEFDSSHQAVSCRFKFR
jgi:hypothetical protein